MKTLLEMLIEHMNIDHNLEKSSNIKLKYIELLYILALIDSTDTTKYFEDTRNKIINVLRPNMTSILRSFKELEKYYNYDNIFDKRSGEEAQRFLDIIIDESNFLLEK